MRAERVAEERVREVTDKLLSDDGQLNGPVTIVNILDARMKAAQKALSDYVTETIYGQRA